MKKPEKAHTRGVVPSQVEGGEENVYVERNFESVGAARAFLEKVKGRIQQINRWSEYSAPGVEFILHDDKGSPVHRTIQANDLIRIKLPIVSAGENYDWVRALSVRDEEPEEDHQLYAIVVRPASSPEEAGHETKHFFDRNTTNTILVSRLGRDVVTGVFARNESLNTEGSLLRLVRDYLITIGSGAGLSALQWNVFVNNLVKD